MAGVNEATTSADFKVSQLHQYYSGDVIKDLEHFPIAY